MSTAAQKPNPEVVKQRPLIIVKYTGFNPNEASETYQSRLAENIEFFSDRPPLVRSLDHNKGNEALGEKMYRNLLQDVKQKLRKPQEGEYRGHLEIKAFWDRVRAGLRDDDDNDDNDDHDLDDGALKEEDSEGECKKVEDKKEDKVESTQERGDIPRTRVIGTVRMSMARSRYIAVSAKGPL